MVVTGSNSRWSGPAGNWIAYSDGSNFGTDVVFVVVAEVANAVAVVNAVATVDVDSMDAVGEIMTAGEAAAVVDGT